MVTKVPMGDRRGWDAVDSTQTLTGALVTAPKATGVLSTRTGRAAAGAMVTVPEAPTLAGAEARGGLISGSRLECSSGSTASLGRGAGTATQGVRY